MSYLLADCVAASEIDQWNNGEKFPDFQATALEKADLWKTICIYVVSVLLITCYVYLMTPITLMTLQEFVALLNIDVCFLF